MYFLLYLFSVHVGKGTATHTFSSRRFTENSGVLANYISGHAAHARLVLQSTSRKQSSPPKLQNKTSKIAFQIRAAFHHMAEKHICKLGLPLWHISNFCHLLTTDMLKLLKNVFFFFSNGKSIFHPSFPKTAGAVWHKCSKNTSTSKGLPNSKRKVKRLGRRTSHWKSFLKMETLVQFQLPNTSIIMSSESEKFKSSLSSGHLGYSLKASQFQS